MPRLLWVFVGLAVLSIAYVSVRGMLQSGGGPTPSPVTSLARGGQAQSILDWPARVVLVAEARRAYDADPNQQTDYRAIAQLLDELGPVLASSQPNALRALVDINQAYTIYERAGGVTLRRHVGTRREVEQTLVEQLLDSAKVNELADYWVQIDLCDLSFSNRNQCVVRARHWNAQREVLELSWHLSRVGHHWHLADIGYIPTAHTAIGEHAQYVREVVRRPHLGPRLDEVLERISQIIDSTDARDVDTARAKIAELHALPYPIPDVLLPLVWRREIDLCVLTEDHERALELLDKAVKLSPRAVLLSYYQGYTLKALQRYDEALERLDHALTIDPFCADTHYTRAELLSAMQRTDEAIAGFQRTLDVMPDSISALQYLVWLLPEERRHETAAYVKVMPQYEDGFELLLQEFEDFADADLIQTLIDAHPAPRDDHTGIALAKAIIHRLNDEHDSAVTLLQPHLHQTDSPYHALAVARYLSSMCILKRWQAAYDALTDKPSAFDYVAWDMLAQEAYEPLRVLIDQHRRDFPDDIWVPYYQARLHQAEEQWDEAEKLLLATRERLTDEADDMFFHRALVHGRISAERALSAYDDIAPASETFAVLARHFHDLADGDSLLALTVLHMGRHPEDVLSHYYEAVAHSLKLHHAKVVAVFDAHYSALAESRPDYRVVAERLYILALLEVKQVDRAMEIAMQSERVDGDPYFRILVHVVGDEHEQAIQVMETCIRDHGYNPAVLLEDEVILPTRRHPAYAAFWNKHLPDPDSEPVAPDHVPAAPN